MPQLGRSFHTSVRGETTTSNAAEDVAATVAGVATDTADQTIQLSGELNITPGAGTTAVQVRVRRTGLAGAQVGQTQQVAIAATVAGVVSFELEDQPGEVGQLSYVMTLQQVGGTGAGTVTGVELVATVI